MYLEEEGEHSQAIGIVDGTVHGTILVLIEDGVKLHRERMIVDEVLWALPVVLAPVKVQLLEDVGAVQRPTRHVRQLAVVRRVQQRCAIDLDITIIFFMIL